MDKELVRSMLQNISIEMNIGGKRESHTENFLYILDNAVQHTLRQVEASHEEGLHLDCVSALASELARVSEVLSVVRTMTQQ